jgi:hypothetical protein
MIQGFYQPTVQSMIELFDVTFSPEKTNKRTAEDQLYLNWIFFLNDVHG